jgi:hypothetical protein
MGEECVGLAPEWLLLPEAEGTEVEKSGHLVLVDPVVVVVLLG